MANTVELSVSVPPPRGHADAERFAAAVCACMGLRVKTTTAGADEGLDLLGPDACGQVKHHLRPVGRPALQQLVGAAAGHEGHKLFFALAGYTPAALTYANAQGVALFRYNTVGLVEAVNTVAREVVAQSAGASQAQVRAAIDAQEWDDKLSSALRVLEGQIAEANRELNRLRREGTWRAKRRLDKARVPAAAVSKTTAKLGKRMSKGKETAWVRGGEGRLLTQLQRDVKSLRRALRLPT